MYRIGNYNQESRANYMNCTSYADNAIHLMRWT